jgi:hypothetical protein
MQQAEVPDHQKRHSEPAEARAIERGFFSAIFCNGQQAHVRPTGGECAPQDVQRQ